MSRLGGNTKFLAQVGDDNIGKDIIKFYENEGV